MWNHDSWKTFELNYQTIYPHGMYLNYFGFRMAEI